MFSCKFVGYFQNFYGGLLLTSVNLIQRKWNWYTAHPHSLNPCYFFMLKLSLPNSRHVTKIYLGMFLYKNGLSNSAIIDVTSSFSELIYPVQVLRWPFDFAPGIKIKFKEFSGKMLKKIKLTETSSFSTWELSKKFLNIYLDHFHYQLCLKYTEIP